MPETSKTKVGLALSGGSALGILHVGVLQSLLDHKIPIDCISGTSAGALAAACYAFGVPLSVMAQESANLNWFKLSKFSYSMLGLITNQAIGDLLNRLLGPVKIEQAKIPLAIIATDLQTGGEVIFSKGDLAEAVMASCCLPGIFMPLTVFGRQLVDGGLVENLPMSPLEAMGANVKIGVNLARYRTYKEPKNLIDVMLNSVDIMTHHQSNLNSAVADILIEPHLEKYTASDWKKSAELIGEGYRAATLAVPAIKKLLEPPAMPVLGLPLKQSWLGKWWKNIFLKPL